MMTEAFSRVFANSLSVKGERLWRQRNQSLHGVRIESCDTVVNYFGHCTIVVGEHWQATLQEQTTFRIKLE